MRLTHRLAIAVAIAWLPRGALAQDVEMLGRHYGTRPPAGYYRELARNPEAYRFEHGRAARMRESAALRTAGGGATGSGALRTPLGRPNGPVIGDFRIPVILGRFSDSGLPPYSGNDVETAFFVSNPEGTVTEYYDEVSGGRAHLTGDVFDWVQSTMSRADVVGDDSGLSCCGVGDFIKDLLAKEPGVDWGQYDNDGPDGLPNSGDDDGYVDVLAVFQPQSGAECDGSTSRIWSHKWALRYASSGSTPTPYSTSSPAANGGTILIDDYFIQGVLSCSGGALSPIGVFTHETGHAFGLPDLYDTRSSGAHEGDGSWDLMSSGNFGCDNSSPHLPCHMGAWTKSVLGWVDVTTLPADTDMGMLTLPPVETTGQVYRVDAEDGSGEYFLIENRQGLGFDRRLYAEGVLIWQIDPGAVAVRWPANTVNSSDHLGVWLRQADGLDQLATPGLQARGDAGDPFPGQSANFVFHAGSNPASRSYPGTATGLTMLDIGPATGDDMQFHLLTRLYNLTVSSTGTTSTTGILTVDGMAADPPNNTIPSAPFDTRVLEAAAGDPTSQPGERVPFQQWQDGPTNRTRSVVTSFADTSFVAEYGGLQYELHVDLTGGVNGVVPGTIATSPSSPDLWFTPGQLVQVEAVPNTGFTFLAWSGALAGRSNPDTITMDAPVQAGADFSVVYAVANADVVFDAAVEQSVQLSVVNGTPPIAWALVGGSLPDGIDLSNAGVINGAALELGVFPVTVQATDATGLTGTGSVTLDVRSPDIPIGQLASLFVLGGPTLSSAQTEFLDRQGNQNGSYDLGDLRAWVIAHPSLPLSAVLAADAPARMLRVPMQLEPKEGSR